jgi:hypothetical protein
MAASRVRTANQRKIEIDEPRSEDVDITLTAVGADNTERLALANNVVVEGVKLDGPVDRVRL